MSSFSLWVSSGCRYTCPPCKPSQMFLGSLTLLAHAREVHGLDTWSDVTAAYPDTRIEVERLVCAECGESVHHDRGEFQAHLDQAHNGMDIKDYYYDHVAGT